MKRKRQSLHPDETVSLTRLALSYCLGKGSVCLVSRSYSLQIAHPKAEFEYCTYQWRRLCQFLPTTRPPKLHVIPTRTAPDGAGQWRLRVSSRYFVTAYNLLYPGGERRITPDVLGLLGAEAIASLWADRARMVMSRGADYCVGRLGLSQYTFEEAQLIHDWIYTLTGAKARLHHSPRSALLPMLWYDNEACITLMQALKDTWMAQAECLRKKFRTPLSEGGPSLVRERERLAAAMLMPQVLHRKAPTSLLQKRSRGRRLPGHSGDLPRPITPPEIKRESNLVDAGGNPL